MIEEVISEKEMDFADELGRNELRWVAIVNFGSEDARVAVSGQSFSEVKRIAEERRLENASFLKVPPAKKIFIPFNVPPKTFEI